MRFLLEGSVRVGGGVPIFSRAAAFTARAALNGLGLRRFAAIFLFRIIAITQNRSWIEFKNFMWPACRPAESRLGLVEEATATPC